ncbi:MAG: hypothetical protein J0M17_09465, partial [Planctomycetes bacterium]|nr:hypothetical protein [Planctomycetota bacterium]
VLEERLRNSPDSASAERQFLWGLRYVDDLVCRDRSPTNSGTLSERFYAIQDANWNVTAIANTSGGVQERYCYAPYGTPNFLNADFSVKSSSGYGSETLYAGYRWDATTGLFGVRWRYLHSSLGVWLTRDPAFAKWGVQQSNLYQYVDSSPTTSLDTFGLEKKVITLRDVVGRQVEVAAEKHENQQSTGDECRDKLNNYLWICGNNYAACVNKSGFWNNICSGYTSWGWRAMCDDKYRECQQTAEKLYNDCEFRKKLPATNREARAVE